MQTLGKRLQLYQRLNRLLQTHQNSKFLQQFDYYQQSFNQAPTETNIAHYLKERSLGLNPNRDTRGESLNVCFESQPLLFRTQQAVIERISQFIIQIDQIQNDTQIEKRLLFGMQKKLDRMRLAQMPLPMHSKQKQNKIEQEQIKVFQQQLASIQRRIHLIKLLDKDIDRKIEDLRQRSRQMEIRLAETKERTAQNQKLIEIKRNLETQIAQMIKDSTTAQDNLDQLVEKGQVEDICQVICQVLIDRIALQNQVTEEETQKQHFAQILGQFQVKYKQVNQKNKILKQRIEELKRSAIFQLLQF